jgi:LysR family transcriptional regulator of beta-lactamase
VQPLQIEVMTGAYWLTRLKNRKQSQAMRVFRDWLLA